MKFYASVFLLSLALGLQSQPGHAQDTVPAPLAAAIAQLDTDLLAIPAGSTVTNARHQTIVTDLNTLAAGIVPPPAAADIDAIATALGNAAVAGYVAADALAEINSDLAADATDADDWTDDITDDAAMLLFTDDTNPGPVITDPSDPGTGGDPNQPIETAVPVFVTAAGPHPRRTRTDREFDLGVESGQSPANQFYDGLVAFVTRQTDGSPSQNTIYVRAVGLPRINPYTLNVTRRSDGAVITVGKFNVQSVSSYEFNVYLTAHTPDGYRESVENITLARAVFGGDNPKRMVPADFDARDVASVALVDAQGVARLSGQIGPRTRNYLSRSAVLHLYGDALAAPTAVAVAKASQSPFHGYQFNLFARHLPANMPVTLVADGVPVGQFTTGANGGLVITEGDYPPIYTRSGERRYPQTLPKTVNLSKIKSLTLTDSQGQVLLSSPAPLVN